MNKNFSRTLNDIMAGPPKISQVQLARKTGLAHSKINRMLFDIILPNRESVAAILQALPRRDQKLRLVSAYLEDVVPKTALHMLRGSKDPWADLQLSAVSPKARNALKALLESHHHPTFEKLVIDLAIAFDLA
jgi:hypothetical protein